MIGPRMSQAGYPITGTTRPTDDAGSEPLVARVSARYTWQIARAQAARDGRAARRRNELMAIMLEQNAHRGGVFVPCFGRPASTATSAAAFALRTGAALIPTFCTRERDGTHTIHAWKPIYPCPTGDRASDLHRLT